MKKYLVTGLLLLLIIAVPSSSLTAEGTAQYGYDNVIEAAVSVMPLEEKVGMMLMTGVSGTGLDDSAVQMIRKCRIGGIILYKYNITDTPQTVRLIHEIQRAAGGNPLLTAIDQEGGKVSRLPMGTAMPGNMALGAAASSQETYNTANAIGRELNALGVNVNLAPVLDVNTNPDNPAVGIRSFGSDPRLVGSMGAAYVKGLQDAGVAAAAKHFPGHGGTPVDSHLDMPVVPYDGEKLENIDLKPFRMVIDSGVDMLMTAHVAYPAFDDTRVVSLKTGRETYLPATLSHRILTGLLRSKLGFKGLIISDSIHMKAISDHFGPPEETVVKAVKAGVDVVIVLRNLEAAYNNLLNEVKNGGITEARIDESIKRILRFKLERGIIKAVGGKLVPGSWMEESLENRIKNAEAIVGCNEHRLIERLAAEKAVTLLKNEGKTLPFRLENGKRAALFVPSSLAYAIAGESFSKVLTDAKKHILFNLFSFNRMKALSQEQKKAVTEADYIVLVTYSSNAYGRNPKEYPGAQFALDLIDFSASKNKPLAVIAAGDPYDIMYMPEAKAYLAVYGLYAPNLQAGFKAVFGLINPSGRLPVNITASGSPQVLYPDGSGTGY